MRCNGWHWGGGGGLAYAARLQPRAKVEGGAVALTLLGLRWGWATDTLAGAMHLWTRKPATAGNPLWDVCLSIALTVRKLCQNLSNHLTISQNMEWYNFASTVWQSPIDILAYVSFSNFVVVLVKILAVYSAMPSFPFVNIHCFFGSFIIIFPAAATFSWLTFCCIVAIFGPTTI